MYAKLENRQGQFHAKEFRLVDAKHKNKVIKNWCSGQQIDQFLKENEFRHGPNGWLETDRELQKNGTLAKIEEATDGDIPIGTMKVNTGGGINNYQMPSIPVQGAIDRLLASEEWPFPDKE